jgi:hypothetical protein
MAGFEVTFNGRFWLTAEAAFGVNHKPVAIAAPDRVRGMGGLEQASVSRTFTGVSFSAIPTPQYEKDKCQKRFDHQNAEKRERDALVTKKDS